MFFVITPCDAQQQTERSAGDVFSVLVEETATILPPRSLHTTTRQRQLYLNSGYEHVVMWLFFFFSDRSGWKTLQSYLNIG